MRQYMRKRRTGMEFREKDNAQLLERKSNKIQTIREKNMRAERKTKITSKEHVREVDKKSLKKNREQRIWTT